MPSAQAQFKEEVTQAHRTALQALHDILADTAAPIDPNDESDDDEYEPALTEPQRLSLRLRAAAAILRVKSPEDDESEDDDNDNAPASPAPLLGRAIGSERAREPEVTQPVCKTVSPLSRGATGEGSSPPSPTLVGEGGGGSATPGEGRALGNEAHERRKSPSDAQRPSSSVLTSRVSKPTSRRRRPLTPAEIKAAKAKATWESIARSNEAAYQDLLILRAKAQQQREAAAAANASKLPPPPHPFASIPAWQQAQAEGLTEDPDPPPAVPSEAHQSAAEPEVIRIAARSRMWGAGVSPARHSLSAHDSPTIGINQPVVETPCGAQRSAAEPEVNQPVAAATEPAT